jgi:hypothetical protein
MRKTNKIVTCLYIDCSSAQLIFTRIHIVDLRSRCGFGLDLGLGTFEDTLLLGASVLLNLEDLEFPVLLANSEDTGGIGGKRAHGCGLRYG